MKIIQSINQFNQWGTAIFWALVTLGILKFFKKYIINFLQKWAQKTKTDLDDVFIDILESIGSPFYLTIALYIGSKFLQLTDSIHRALTTILLIVISYYIVRGLQQLIDYFLNQLLQKRAQKNPQDQMVLKTMGKIAKSGLWILAILVILQNLGFQMSALLGGLGLGGLAIAFAFQNILEDLFAYFTIYFDKPFQINDYIVIGNDSGTVEKVGLKSTRIRTLQGELLIVSNKELTNSRINNFKQLKKRRATFTLGITYETPTSKLKKISGIIKKIFKEQKNAELDRVHFKAFGDFSLNFEIVYYFNSSNYKKFMDNRQKINLQILEQFEKEGINMAYPTQTVYLPKIVQS